MPIKLVSLEALELQDIFASLSRDKTLDSSTRDLVQHRWTITRQQLEPSGRNP